MKKLLRRLLGPGLWSDVRNSFAAHRRLCRNALTKLLPRKTLKGVHGTDLLLHLGCGPRRQDGWVNVDASPDLGAYYADFRNPLELDNRSVRHIHCEHVLEHLEYDEAVSFLRECHRVLTENGSLRVIVPDAEKYLRAYAAEDGSFFAPLRRLGNATEPLETRMAIINQMFRMGGAHCYAWDFEDLARALHAARFKRVEKSSLCDVPPDLCIDGTDDWRPHESLYVNAFKQASEKSENSISNRELTTLARDP